MKFNQFNNPSSGYDGFFNFESDYIYFEFLILDKEGEELHTQPKIKICSPLNFVGRSHGKDGNYHGIIISFIDPDGIEKKFRILFSELQADGLSVRKALSHHGFYINPCRLARKLFNELLLSAVLDEVFVHDSIFLHEPVLFLEIGSENDEKFICQ